MKKLYTYPQETWDEAKCRKMSRRRGMDGCGTPDPWPGLIASASSTSPQYGQTIRYNGGTIIDGEHYQSVCRPLPVIPATFRFVHRLTWGTYIEPLAP